MCSKTVPSKEAIYLRQAELWQSTNLKNNNLYVTQKQHHSGLLTLDTRRERYVERSASKK